MATQPPISFSKFRKARAKAGEKARAAENRVKHGRTKSEKAKAEADRKLAAKRLDEHERE